MGSQVGFWNGIPSGMPEGIGRILGGILTRQTFSIYVWFTAGSQVGLESQLGSRVGSQEQALKKEFPRWDPSFSHRWFSPVTSYSVRSGAVSFVRDRGPELIAK